jgi:hypothetical protein
MNFGSKWNVIPHRGSKPPVSKLAREVRRIGRQASNLPRTTFKLIKPAIQPLLRRAYRRGPSPTVDFASIRAQYELSPLAAEPETFCLTRIIGNDLVPRHRKGQSRENIAFILEHEPAFEGCTKFWVLNRIFDAEEEATIIRLLEDRRQHYHRIPFDLAAYAQQPWDIEGVPEHMLELLDDDREEAFRKQTRVGTLVRRSKSNYAINNNGARNVALTVGRDMAKWVLPWDGNSFLTEAAWEAIRSSIAEKPFLPYFVVPMARITDNAALLQANFRPRAGDEPQIIFRRDAEEIFDEQFPYGHRPKVELLWRLGVPGVWDHFDIKEHDLPRPPLCEDAGKFAEAGWVARLNSGNRELEVGRKNSKRRGAARDEAIVAFLDMLDRSCMEANLMPPQSLALQWRAFAPTRRS